MHPSNAVVGEEMSFPSSVVYPTLIFLAGLAALAVPLLLPVAASAQRSPAKTVRLVVPFAPGGSTAIIGRTVAQKLTELWGQTVIVDNRPGGSTVIGTDIVAKSPPDGHTLLVT